MDISGHEIIEIIDLCTPNLDVNDIVAVPVVKEDVSTSTITVQPYTNLKNRLSILP